MGLLSSLPPGQALPSVREFMAMYNASQSTIERALADFKQRGIVETVAGKGMFVTDDSQSIPTISTVDLLFFAQSRAVNKPGFHRDLCLTFSSQLGKEGMSQRESILPVDASRDMVEELLKRLKPQALIVVNMFDREMVSLFQQYAIPYILLFPNWPSVLPQSINVDNRSVVRCWVDHLLELGHSKIAHIHSDDPTCFFRDMNERRNMLFEELARAGIAADPDLHVFGGFLKETAQEAIEQLFASGKEFTAVIANDIFVSQVYSQIRKHNLTVGKDISVIGTDDLELAAHLAPPLTTVRVSRSSVVEMAMKKLHATLEKKTGFDAPEFIEATLVRRSSTSQAN